MAPRMHIEVGDAPEPEAGATQAAPTPSVAAPAPQAPKAQVQAPRAKVDTPVEPVEGAAAPIAAPAPGADAPTASKPAASGSKPAAAPKPSTRPQVKVARAVETDRAADVEGRFEFANEEAGRRAAAVASAYEAASTGASDEGASAKARPSLTAWVRRTFPGHVHAFWGAVVAVVVALLTFAIGLPRMLLIAILVLIGIALGQVLDGDPKIIRTIRDLFSSDRER